MTNKRQFADVDTSRNARVKTEEPEELSSIPLSVVRWLCYSLAFGLFLIPFYLTTWQNVAGGLILGWFSSQLNALIHKK